MKTTWLIECPYDCRRFDTLTAFWTHCLDTHQVILAHEADEMTLKSLNADFNTRVKAGQVLAQIDPALFQSRLDQDKANLARAVAEVDRVKAGLVQSERDLERSRKLSSGGLVPASDLQVQLYSQQSVEVAKNRVGYDPLVNFSVAAAGVTAYNGMKLYDPGFVDGQGAPLPLAVIGGSANASIRTR